MNKSEAEAYVYKSYIKAEKYQDYDAKDAEKRRPDLTKDIIRKRSISPCALVTGSKGKGSVSVMISQILQTELKVGLMTSPHISDFCERFRVNGKFISDKDFIKVIEKLKPEFDSIEAEIPQDVCISPMGVQALVGLEYFNEQKTEFNVFECGKGVRYDDVNNIIHQYAVINSIFLEHTRELGNTLAEIAENKSYIINGEQKAVFVAKQSPEVMSVLQDRAKIYGTNLKLYGRDFRTENIRFTEQGMRFDVVVDRIRYEDIIIPLMGRHQAENCALAMALCKEVLADFSLIKVKENLKRLEWPGRMEVLSEKPFVMLDACINGASCANIKEVLNNLGINSVAAIVGIPDDKDYAGVVQEVNSVADHIFLTRSQNPHYVFTKRQIENMKRQGIETTWTNTVEEALLKARETSLPIIILGTTSVVAEVKGIFNKLENINEEH